MNGFELSRAWFEYSFNNPEKIKPIHSAIYFFAIEHCNRLGWKEKFGFPSQMVMEAIGVKNWKTYSKGLNDLVLFGFIEMIEVSKNQYSSNIIALVKNTKAHTKALDKALSKHSTKHSQGTVSITKQRTNNKEQSMCENDISHGEGEKEIEPEEVFEEFRKLFPGRKPGQKMAWEHFKKKYKKQVAEIVPLLIPALEREKADKQKRGDRGLHVPSWKNFKTWINNACWTEEPAEITPVGAGKASNTGQDLTKLNDCELPDAMENQYQKYIEWVSATYPALMRSSCKILSKDEYFDLKTDRTCKMRKTRILDSEMTQIFKKAHKELDLKGYLRNEYKKVETYTRFLMKEYFQVYA